MIADRSSVLAHQVAHQMRRWPAGTKSWTDGGNSHT